MLFVALCLLLAGTACEDGRDRDVNGPAPGDSLDLVLALDTVASGLSGLVFVTSPPGDARLFSVQKSGVIRVIESGGLLPTPFLNLSGRVSTGGEQGLLSLAFAPDYATSGEFYVDYTDVDSITRVVRYRVSADPNVADASSADTVLTVVQPFANHNGGLVAFGPDGMLYVGLGDGGSGGDPEGNGQDTTTLLGSILRIDVDGETTYAVPPDNPLVDAPGARPEIWGYGLRNPWRFSFDRVSDDLYIADVGQGQWEEVNVEPAGSGGRNYGWNLMEGMHCFGAPTCNLAGMTLPVLEYSHGEGCSVTGGYVYRGSEIPELQGRYFYGDFCSGFVRSFRYVGGAATVEQDWTSQLGTIGSLSSFGEDASGELYITTLTGSVYRIVPAGG
ncbi:MAG: PQQ-dependent sugar dehydrogenase [Gemmatimonadota bacterium]